MASLHFFKGRRVHSMQQDFTDLATPQLIEVTLGGVCALIKPGHRIRLQVRVRVRVRVRVHVLVRAAAMLALPSLACPLGDWLLTGTCLSVGSFFWCAGLQWRLPSIRSQRRHQ